MAQFRAHVTGMKHRCKLQNKLASATSSKASFFGVGAAAFGFLQSGLRIGVMWGVATGALSSLPGVIANMAASCVIASVVASCVSALSGPGLGAEVTAETNGTVSVPGVSPFSCSELGKETTSPVWASVPGVSPPSCSELAKENKGAVWTSVPRVSPPSCSELGMATAGPVWTSAPSVRSELGLETKKPV